MVPAAFNFISWMVPAILRFQTSYLTPSVVTTLLGQGSTGGITTASFLQLIIKNAKELIIKIFFSKLVLFINFSLIRNRHESLKIGDTISLDNPNLFGYPIKNIF